MSSASMATPPNSRWETTLEWTRIFVPSSESSHASASSTTARALATFRPKATPDLLSSWAAVTASPCCTRACLEDYTATSLTVRPFGGCSSCSSSSIPMPNSTVSPTPSTERKQPSKLRRHRHRLFSSSPSAPTVLSPRLLVVFSLSLFLVSLVQTRVLLLDPLLIVRTQFLSILYA